MITRLVVRLRCCRVCMRALVSGPGSRFVIVVVSRVRLVHHLVRIERLAYPLRGSQEVLGDAGGVDESQNPTLNFDGKRLDVGRVRA
ncbi:MAG TPA: hypothetical protein VF424_07360 [Vicinamibacterales bacterium]